MVRAKFRVFKVEVTDASKHNPATGQYESCDGFTIHMAPVTGASEENKKFFASTPGGQIVLHTVNQEAGVQFERGKEYYIDFSPAS